MPPASMRRARSTTVVGLTIEPGLIAAAHVAVNGSIVVRDGGRGELEPGVVRDGEVAAPQALAEALRELWSEHRQLDKRVRIGVANARVAVRTLLLPPIADAKQLATAVRFAAADEIPMALDDAVLDYQPAGIVDTPQGPRQRIVLVAARRDMIVEVLSAARAAGLKPTGIDLSAFGMVRGLRRAGGDGGPELFVSVGGLTNLAVAADGLCTFTRVAGSGLESLAGELAERRELTLRAARAWLHRVGLEDDLEALDGDAELVADVRSLLTGGVRRIAAEVRASLDFHQGQSAAGDAVRRIVLTGPAVAIAGFPAALEAELGLEVDERVVEGAPELGLSPVDAGCLSVAAGLAVADGPAA